MTQFETGKQQECYELIADYLVVLDLQYIENEDPPAFILPYDDGVSLYIFVTPWGGDSDALVEVIVPVKERPSLAPALMETLLRANLSCRMGFFAVDGQGDLILRHTLGGNDLDPGELGDAVDLLKASASRWAAELPG